MKKIPIKHITSSHLAQPDAGRFSIRSLQHILNGKDLVHDLHKHDYYFVLALQKGVGRHEIDFIPYEVQDHSIFIVRPGQVHRLALKANSTGFLMEFDLGFYRPKNTITDHRWQKASAKNCCKVEAGRFEKLLVFLSALLGEFTAKEEGYVEAIKANLDLFFIEYIRQSRHPKSIPKTESSYTQERFEKLLHLLETNIVTMKNVAQYAQLMNLSAYQLNAITKSSVGKTVSDLINEQLILEAKRCLLATSNQVKDIADLLGFEDVSYFIRFFKKHTGSSPDAFRKNFK